MDFIRSAFLQNPYFRQKMKLWTNLNDYRLSKKSLIVKLKSTTRIYERFSNWALALVNFTIFQNYVSKAIKIIYSFHYIIKSRFQSFLIFFLLWFFCRLIHQTKSSLITIFWSLLKKKYWPDCTMVWNYLMFTSQPLIVSKKKTPI